MVFNSWEFVCFFAVVLSLYYVLNVRSQNMFLLAASYFFYGWWDWRFLCLLWLSTVVDYLVARGLARVGDRERSRKGLLVLSIVTNLGILGVFKYFNFFVGSATAVLHQLGIPCSEIVLRIVLPMGISFYTFQSLAYTIDVYRRRLPPEKSLLLFALYVSFFPQLVAGPIERAQHLLPTLRKPRRVTEWNIVSGITLILVGLVRKIAVADFLSGTVTTAFSSPSSMSSAQLLIALYAFALVIYSDFAGYSDIARGVSRMMGIELMVNFCRPYLAVNITDFWRRWHISLSTWLRDYLYIPLGGNRHGTMNTHRNIMLTMLLGGLWHGATWNFVIWGGLHGVFLVGHKLWLACLGRTPKDSPHYHGWRALITLTVGIVVTFHLVCLSWVFFRAPTLHAAIVYLKGIAQCHGGIGTLELIDLHRVLMAAIVVMFIDSGKALAERRHADFYSLPFVVKGVFAGLMLCVLFVLGDKVHVPFIYFQF